MNGEVLNLDDGLLAIRQGLLRNEDFERGVRVLEEHHCPKDSQLYREYERLMSVRQMRGKIPSKDKATFTAKFILQAFQLLKLKETNVFYIGRADSPLFRKCQSIEELSAYVSEYYQKFFGFSADIGDATKALVAGILPDELYPSVDRSYIQVDDNWYWHIPPAELVRAEDLPPNTRVFAKMFDTDRDDDENIFKVPRFTEEASALFYMTYTGLKNKAYEDWPEEYHFQCFKDWSDNRPDVEFGMFTVLAIPFMRPSIMRGSIFNTGVGHNGKSVLNGLATSIIGSRNTTQVSGNDLGKWDFLVDLQTTWFNCPSETELDFLKENTGAFKTISAHETLAIRKKHGDASVPVSGAFPTVFNINKMPDLGSDASAILSRMFVNNFDVDFEATGRAVKGYARKTFLSDWMTMPILTGAVLAFAHYYSQPEHLWAPSPSMTAERDAIREAATPQFRYIHWFKVFFQGYEGVKILKYDFSNFGRMEGEEYDTSEIKTQGLILKPFKRVSSGEGTKYLLEEEPYPVIRFVLSDNLYIRKYMGSMSFDEYRNSGSSLVYDMMLDYISRDSEYRDRLKRYYEDRTEDEIRKKVLQDMFKDIEDAQKGAPYER